MGKLEVPGQLQVIKISYTKYTYFIINILFLEFEKRAIRATAKAQRQLGCPVSFHPGRNAKAPFEIMRIFQEAGGDTKKTIMSHLDSKTISIEDKKI